VNHVLTPEYWEHYAVLPKNLQARADFCFATLRENPRHPSLRLKRVGKLWSLRINNRYRALGVPQPEHILWHWIGSHVEYDKILRRLRGG